jgi:hypothetical protein
VISTTTNCHAAKRATRPATVLATAFRLPAAFLKQRLPTAMAPGGQDLTSGVVAVLVLVLSCFVTSCQVGSVLLDTGTTSCGSAVLPLAAACFPGMHCLHMGTKKQQGRGRSAALAAAVSCIWGLNGSLQA